MHQSPANCRPRSRTPPGGLRRSLCEEGLPAPPHHLHHLTSGPNKRLAQPACSPSPLCSRQLGFPWQQEDFWRCGWSQQPSCTASTHLPLHLFICSSRLLLQPDILPTNHCCSRLWDPGHGSSESRAAVWGGGGGTKGECFNTKGPIQEMGNIRTCTWRGREERQQKLQVEPAEPGT